MVSDNNVIFLLGAGASKGIGLPTSVELLTNITEWIGLATNPYASPAVDAVIEALKTSGREPNFEDVLSAIASLAQRDKTELWPFISELREPFAEIVKIQPEFFDGLYQVILGFVRSQLDITHAKNSDWSFLKNLVQIAKRSSTPTICTLNYDLSLEMSMDSEHISYSTGFVKPEGIHSTYLPSGVDCWPFGYLRQTNILSSLDFFSQTSESEVADVRLIKVHGSLDWFRIAHRPVYEGGLRLFPEDLIVRCDFLPSETIEEIMIIGRSGKQRLEEPFLPLLREFHYAALKAGIIVVIGYSFSDEHINRVLINAQLMERLSSFDLIVINGPDWSKSARNAQTMSDEAHRAWSILLSAGKQSFDLENLTGVQVLPYYANQAINEGHLQKALKDIIKQRADRGT